MRKVIRCLLTGLLLSSVATPIWVQSVSADTAEEAAVDFAQKAVPRALNYDQGNRESFVDAQEDFTPEAWREFLKWLDGYLDNNGAPTGSSVFTASGKPVLKSQANGVLRLTLAGTLKQENSKGSRVLSRMIFRSAGILSKFSILKPRSAWARVVVTSYFSCAYLAGLRPATQGQSDCASVPIASAT